MLRVLQETLQTALVRSPPPRRPPSPSWKTGSPTNMELKFKSQAAAHLLIHWVTLKPPPKVPDRLMRGRQAANSFVQLFTSNIFIHSEGGAEEGKFLTLFIVICVTRSWFCVNLSHQPSKQLELCNSWIFWGCRLTPPLTRTTGRLLHWQQEQIRRYL